MKQRRNIARHSFTSILSVLFDGRGEQVTSYHCKRRGEIRLQRLFRTGDRKPSRMETRKAATKGERGDYEGVAGSD